MKHIKLQTLSIKDHPQLDEKWLQKIVAEDPSILGIGDVILKDKERIHSRAGRLDLLLQDVDGSERYEVEIQLGATDESHIIRTIEYWDLERKRYPQYNHTAVIVAEDITSRFLNVVGLFNGFIPLIAIQVTAIETPEGVGLQFTKILSAVELGYPDEDEETSEPTDRNYWEKQRGTKQTVALADKVLDITKLFLPSVEFNYNKYYIGFLVESRACNFALCQPQKNAFRISIRLPETTENTELITNAELDLLDYNKRRGSYKLKLNESDITQKHETLGILLKRAYELHK